jgi:hypothetical protein
MTFAEAGSPETPGRSLAQRREALARANRVRSERAHLKAALKRGDASLGSLLRDPPASLASAKIEVVLRALPGYGPAKAARLLERCQVSPRKTVGGLTQRQREALIAMLEE